MRAQGPQPTKCGSSFVIRLETSGWRYSVSRELVVVSLTLLLTQWPATAQESSSPVEFTDSPGLSGWVGGDSSGVSSESEIHPNPPSSLEPYEFLELRPKDFFLNRPCGPDQAMAAVEVWLITGPPHLESFQYRTIECVPVPWWLDPDPPVDVPALNQPSAQAIIREYLPVPTVTLDPDTHGITGLETWLWYEDDGAQSLEPVDHDDDPATPPKQGLTVSDREGPYSISATVWIDHYAWDMGDETIVTSAQPGSAEDPAATHVYRTKNQDYTVTCHVVWAGRYSWASPDGSGTDLDMGSLDVSSEPRPYPVYEVRSVPADG